MISKKINLGCGLDYRQGYLNVDQNHRIKADQYWNLNKFPYPWSDNYFEEILAIDILEHLKQIPEVMEEIYRIAKPGAMVKIRVPHFSSFNAFTDPTHKHFFSSQSFDYFIPGTKYYQKYQIGPAKLLKKKMFLGAENPPFFNPLKKILWLVRNRYTQFYERHLAFIFPVDSINIELEVVK